MKGTIKAQDGYIWFSSFYVDKEETRSVKEIFSKHPGGIVPLEVLARELADRFKHRTFVVLAEDNPITAHLIQIGQKVYRLKGGLVYDEFIPYLNQKFLNQN